MMAPLKNLSELMKNRTFFARFSAEMWISDVLWCGCDDDATLSVDWGLVVPFLASPFWVISSFCWLSLMQTLRNWTVTSFLLLMLLVAVLIRLERGLGTLFRLEQEERPAKKFVDQLIQDFIRLISKITRLLWSVSQRWKTRQVVSYCSPIFMLRIKFETSKRPYTLH